MRGGITPVLHGLRVLTLLLFAAAILAVFYYVPQSAPLTLALALLGGFAIALVRLRHPGLALAAVLAPVPGTLWFGSSAYALILAFAILATSSYSDALLKGEKGIRALAKPFPALAGTLLFALVWSVHVPVQIQSLLATAAATLLFLPALVLAAPFDEDAIVRGNRWRETSTRIFAFAARITEPRWSISFTGVGMVLAVMGYFRMPLHPPVFDWLAVPACGAIVFALGREIRGASAALAVCALLLFFTGGVSGVLLLFLLLALVLCRATAAWQRQGETGAMAWTRAFEDCGSTLLFAGLAAMIAAAPRGGLLAILHASFGVIAALVLLPAFAGTLHKLFPRRRSVEELYRV